VKAEKCLRILAFNVKAARLYCGYTLPELAANAGVSKGLLSKLENGGNVTFLSLSKVADALGCWPSELFDWPESKGGAK
jgi:transcriptional regulator with XRE-family HTH domain